MSIEPRVVRCFYIGRALDLDIARLSLQRNVIGAELLRQILQIALQSVMTGTMAIESLSVVDGTDLDERAGDDRVLRTVYLDREFDNFLRQAAFELGCSKSELVRRVIGLTLQAAPLAAHIYGVPLKDPFSVKSS
jgi:hypothetical protein